jgi:hypothetical protein
MISRRKLMHASLGAFMSTSVPQLGATATSAIPANELLEIYQRLSGSFDDRLIIWWMSGTQYGVVDARTQALFGMEVGMFHRWYRQPDGSFRAAFFELTYFTDLATGALLRDFKNPYTGQTNVARHTRLGPEIRLLTGAGLASPDNPLVKEYAGSLGPAVINGERIWIPAAVEALVKFPKPTAPEILINIYTTVQGSLTDAQNSQLISAPCTLEFHNVQRWMPWMRMEDQPGNMMATASGRKLESMTDLPAAYLAMAEEVHGKYIADPADLLEKLAAKNGLI